jgi:hypothetical protein
MIARPMLRIQPSRIRPGHWAVLGRYTERFHEAIRTGIPPEHLTWDSVGQLYRVAPESLPALARIVNWHNGPGQTATVAA